MASRGALDLSEQSHWTGSPQLLRIQLRTGWRMHFLLTWTPGLELAAQLSSPWNALGVNCMLQSLSSVCFGWLCIKVARKRMLGLAGVLDGIVRSVLP